MHPGSGAPTRPSPDASVSQITSGCCSLRRDRSRSESRAEITACSSSSWPSATRSKSAGVQTTFQIEPASFARCSAYSRRNSGTQGTDIRSARSRARVVVPVDSAPRMTIRRTTPRSIGRGSDPSEAGPIEDPSRSFIGWRMSRLSHGPGRVILTCGRGERHDQPSTQNSLNGTVRCHVVSAPAGSDAMSPTPSSSVSGHS